jgi:FtsZ-interacting cell division protein ZipA
MKEKARSRIAKITLALSYVAMLLAAIWRSRQDRAVPSRNTSAESPTSSAIRQKAKETSDEVGDQTSIGKDDPIASLSRFAAGDSPLDCLARTAATERRAEEEGEPTEAAIPPFDQIPRSWQYEDQAVLAALRHQALDGERLEGWNKPMPDQLPVPTFTPAIMAFGIVLFAMGLATVWYVCLVGSLVFAVAARRWVGVLQGE